MVNLECEYSNLLLSQRVARSFVFREYHMRFNLRNFLLPALLLVSAGLYADDWPQWMGPTRDDVWHEQGILDKFPAGGPKILWRVPIAGGYAGPAVAGGKVYVTDYVKADGEAQNDPGGRANLKGKERVLCLNAASGAPIWKHEYDCPYNISYASGPRTTPAISGGKVYSLGAEGHLFCLDAASGTVLWAKDLKKEYKTDAPFWGFCSHPLVEGNKVICLVSPAAVAVAFDKDTGKELWRSLTTNAADVAYCPPKIIAAGGTRQLLIWHSESLNSLNPETGKAYWSERLEPQYGMACAGPQQSGDFLFVSGIGKLAVLFKLDRAKPAATIVWEAKPTTGVFCSNSTPIIDGQTIFGADCEVGCLRAVKLDTSERLWETFKPTCGGDRRMSHGNAFLTKNSDRYFIFSETGDLILARLTPEKYEEIGRAHLLEPTNEAFGRHVVWSHPAFANKCVFVRNDKEIVCVSLASP